MIRKHSLIFVLFIVAALSSLPLHAQQKQETFSEPGFVSGTMEIDFGTRRNLDSSGNLAEGSPAEGSKDIYKLNLNVAKTTEYSGQISRYPRLESKILGREIQAAQLAFDVNLAVRNPQNLEQKKNVGKWVGSVIVDSNGVYDFGTGVEGSSPLRMAIDSVGKATAFTGQFSGKVYGKGAEKKSVVQQKVQEYSRLVNGKKVTIKVKKVDPLRFSNLVLGQGPAQVYPQTTVNGNLDYDYDTGNWLTNGIHFKYSSNGVDMNDVVTGSIKWVEDANRSTNGKGQYEFNLRFNEDKTKPVSDESAAFVGDASQAEDAFFQVDNSVPGMSGTVSYVDTLVPGAGEEDEPTVLSSKVVYSLDANKLTKTQAVNLYKLLMVVVGPMNDE